MSKEKEQSVTPAYKVYSDILKKPFDTVEELVAAENEYKKLAEEKEKKLQEKKSRAEEIEQAFKDIETAKKEASEIIRAAEEKYRKLKSEFIKDYGSYHLSYYNDNGNESISISDLIDICFGNCW